MLRIEALVVLSSLLLPVNSQQPYPPEVVAARGSPHDPAPLGLRLPHPDGAHPRPKFRDNVGESTELTINEMSCQSTGDEPHFRVSLQPLRGFAEPVIEGTNGQRCQVSRLPNEYRVDIGREEFGRCVSDCSAEPGAHKLHCLGLRFPAIPGLRLEQDLRATLRCRAHETTASHTRRLNLKAIDTSAKMARRVVTAGGQGNQAFDTELELYRKTFGSEEAFNGKVEPGGTVVLGEELLLRARVRPGDGWRYSRMSDVTVEFAGKRSTRSLRILDGGGCPKPQVRDICPGEQYRGAEGNPLESHLLLRAFMFEGMRETDEMVLAARVSGCLGSDDCALGPCGPGHARRARREARDNNATLHEWPRSHVTFRVVESTRTSDYSKAEVLLATMVVLAILGGLLILTGTRTRSE